MYDPDNRITAFDALNHKWFKMEPHMVRPDNFPTWPAKSERTKTTSAVANNKNPGNTPLAPRGGDPLTKTDDELFKAFGVDKKKVNHHRGFTLKF